MLKAMALLRTVVLVFLVGYLLWELPFALIVFGKTIGNVNVDEALSMVKKVSGVALLAIAWVAIETVAAWARAWAAGRSVRKATTAPPAAGPTGAR